MGAQRQYACSRMSCARLGMRILWRCVPKHARLLFARGACGFVSQEKQCPADLPCRRTCGELRTDCDEVFRKIIIIIIIIIISRINDILRTVEHAWRCCWEACVLDVGLSHGLKASRNVGTQRDETAKPRPTARSTRLVGAWAFDLEVGAAPITGTPWLEKILGVSPEYESKRLPSR